MEIEMLELLFNYSVDHKLVDNDYIEKLVSIYVNNMEIDRYVHIVNIYDEDLLNRGFLASYNPGSKCINVYKDSIEIMLKYHEKKCIDLSFIEKTLYKNILITQVILHELEHANQRKIMVHSDGIEAQLLILCILKIDKVREMVSFGLSDKQIVTMLADDIEFFRKNYEIYYKLAPHERLAEVKSHLIIINMLKKIKENIPSLFELENNNLLECLYRGYNDSLAPTVQYIKNVGNEKNLFSFDWYSHDSDMSYLLLNAKYSLRQRMALGLNISEEEKETFSNNLKLTNKLKVRYVK